MENVTISDLNNTSPKIIVPCAEPLPFSAVLFLGYFSMISCFMAIFGNLLCMFILSSSSSMRSASVSRILLTLSVADFIYGISALFAFCMQVFGQYYCIWDYYMYWILPLISPALYSISVTAQMASVYLAVIISFERYIVVCHPLQAKLRCTPNRTTRLCAGAVAFAILFNLSVWWETEALPVKIKFPEQDVMDAYTFEYTTLFKNPIYFKYYVKWGSFIVLRLIPFTVLIVLNSIIGYTVIQMNRTRHNMSQTQIKEISITKMLLAVIFLFLTCNFLKIVVYMTESTEEVMFWVYLSNFLVIANAGFNFIIYCFFSKGFRTASKNIICQMFCCGQ